MPTLTITRGLPGSGKSTWARQQQADYQNIRLAGRDRIRQMLGPAPWPHGDSRSEYLVTIAQHAVIRALLGEGCDVIADDTALPMAEVHYLSAVALSVGPGIEVHVEDFTRVPLNVCITRDARRPADERVGATRIRAMWQRHLANYSKEA